MSNYELHPKEISEICADLERLLSEETRSISRAIGHFKDYQRLGRIPDLIDRAYQNLENAFIRFEPLQSHWSDLRLYMNWNDIPTYEGVTCFRDLIILKEKDALSELPRGYRDPIYVELNGYFSDLSTILNQVWRQTETVVITNAQDIEKIINHAGSKEVKTNHIDRKKLEEEVQEYFTSPPQRERLSQDAAVSEVNSSVKSKSSHQRGEARIKIIAALTMHHKYKEDSCLNFVPIKNNELARLADVSPSTVSEFFKKEFEGYPKYRKTCSDKQGILINSLKLLNNEVHPSMLYGTEPPDNSSNYDE